jgi:DNA-binding SARP family transcriptional activator
MVTAVASPRSRRARQAVSVGTRLTLLNGFELVCDGVTVPLPMSAQRLVAFLALHRRPALRAFVAGALWLETSEERAQANLRSTLWRLHRCNKELVEVNVHQLRLGPRVQVDLLEAERIGVELSEEFQLHPEQSTDALIVHHPEANYFNAR